MEVDSETQAALENQLRQERQAKLYQETEAKAKAAAESARLAGKKIADEFIAGAKTEFGAAAKTVEKDVGEAGKVVAKDVGSIPGKGYGAAKKLIGAAYRGVKSVPVGAYNTAKSGLKAEYQNAKVAARIEPRPARQVQRSNRFAFTVNPSFMNYGSRPKAQPGSGKPLFASRQSKPARSGGLRLGINPAFTSFGFSKGKPGKKSGSRYQLTINKSFIVGGKK